MHVLVGISVHVGDINAPIITILHRTVIACYRGQAHITHEKKTVTLFVLEGLQGP